MQIDRETLLRQIGHSTLDQLTLNELRLLLCEWLGCAAASPEPAALAVLHGTVAGDAFHFGLTLTGPAGSQPVEFVLDTGAFVMLLRAWVASALGLPDLGNLNISGIGGSSPAYTSQVGFTLGAHAFNEVHCVVDPTFPGPALFGLRFFIDHGLSLSLDPGAGELTIRQG
ncbi:MAG: aspartyl protease family protein [Firmicutes bacterium]|nr:aspartyl protease family protein [Bacillota bacterium]